LLINSKVGINSRWLSTTDNVIADEISRLKKLASATILTNQSTSPLSSSLFHSCRPAESTAQPRASLLHLAMSVDEELANSKPDKTIKTARARQAYFVRFMHSLGLDPCGNYSNLQSLLAMYTKMISTGENIVNKGCLRSDLLLLTLVKSTSFFLKEPAETNRSSQPNSPGDNSLQENTRRRKRGKATKATHKLDGGKNHQAR
jgi:hypothetical protein